MPKFLDNLLSKIGDVCQEKKPSPHAVIKALQQARVGRSVLDIIGKGGKFSAESVTACYRGAVSDFFVEILYKAGDLSYDKLAATKVRTIWLYAMPLVIILAAAAALYDKDGWLPPEYATFADWGLAVVALPVIWLAAGLAGKYDIQATVGRKAARLPRQGMWPWVTLSCVSLVHGFLLTTPYDAYRLQLPFSLKPTVTADALFRFMPMLAPVSSNQSPTTFPGSAVLPALQLRPVPPDSQIPGIPSAWKMQSGLYQLGFYHGPINGAKATPELRNALEAFLETVPNYLNEYIHFSLNDVLDKALHGEVRLKLPADTTLAAPMSNLARANLKSSDIYQLQVATVRAGQQPGRVQTWRSADGQRSGQVLMSQTSGMNCGTFMLRIEINGAAENSGPLQACKEGGQWRLR